MSALLEGDLFAEGPSFPYQPSIKELQRSAFQLAYNIGRAIDPAGVQSLAMESVEWFPAEPIFWVNLSETFGSSIKELAIKASVLQKACRMLPFDAALKGALRSTQIAIGREPPAPGTVPLAIADRPCSDKGTKRPTCQYLPFTKHLALLCSADSNEIGGPSPCRGRGT